jgi:hypothetical protein
MINIATITFLILSLSPGMSSNRQNAKRAAPKEVAPVVYEGIRYSAPHWVRANGKRIAGGYIEAFNAKTNKKLWRIKVYEIRNSPELEKDVQNVFITSMVIEKNQLVVVNERDERYEIDLKTRKVSKR